LAIGVHYIKTTHMTIEAATRAYAIDAPFEKARKLLRSAFAQSGLAVLAELDLSAALRRDLRINLAACRLWLVYCPISLVETVALHPSAGVLLPLHVVLSGKGGKSCAHILDPDLWHTALGGEDVARLFNAQLTRLLPALERVASRADLLAGLSA